MKEDSNRLYFWFFAFCFSFAFFHILPALLTSYLKWPLTGGDTLDFITPFAVIPLAYIFYSRTNKTLYSIHGQLPSLDNLRISARIFLAVGFLCYVSGHGIHLSSNSLARLVQNMKDSELYRATYLFDETISHLIWHGGVFLISVGLVIIASKFFIKSISWKNIILLSAGAVLFGFTFTAEAIEGQSVVLAFPATGVGFLLALFLYFRRQKERGKYPFLIFFLGSFLLSFILFVCWGIYHSGFPQFSELGGI